MRTAKEPVGAGETTTLPGWSPNDVPLQSQADVYEVLQGTSLLDEDTYLIGRTRNLMLDLLDRLLEEYRMGRHAHAVLSIACANNHCTQRRLAQALKIGDSRMVHIIDELEKRGHVERQVDPSDRRSRIIVATAEGRDLHTRIARSVQQMEAWVFDGVSEEDRSVMRRVLSRAAFRPRLTPSANASH